MGARLPAAGAGGGHRIAGADKLEIGCKADAGKVTVALQQAVGAVFENCDIQVGIGRDHVRQIIGCGHVGMDLPRQGILYQAGIALCLLLNGLLVACWFSRSRYKPSRAMVTVTNTPVMMETLARGDRVIVRRLMID